jgi:plastocyanin
VLPNSLSIKFRTGKSALAIVKQGMFVRSIRRVVQALILGATFVSAAPALADDTVQLSITMKDHQFDPAELQAPPGKTIAIHVKNLNNIVSEFESSDLHFEKIVPVGGEGTVYVRPQQPGRYNFFDDFHHETQGFLVVQ